MKKFLNHFFLYFGCFTFIFFGAYFITKNKIALAFLSGMEFVDDKEALISFIWLTGASLILAFVVIKDEKKKKRKAEEEKLCKKDDKLIL